MEGIPENDVAQTLDAERAGDQAPALATEATPSLQDYGVQFWF
jgi:hypothetical protein